MVWMRRGWGIWNRDGDWAWDWEWDVEVGYGGDATTADDQQTTGGLDIRYSSDNTVRSRFWSITRYTGTMMMKEIT